jgi:hypothetical protein
MNTEYDNFEISILNNFFCIIVNYISFYLLYALIKANT